MNIISIYCGAIMGAITFLFTIQFTIKILWLIICIPILVFFVIPFNIFLALKELGTKIIKWFKNRK